MLQSMTVEFPLTTFQKLEQLAQRKKSSVPKLVESLVEEAMVTLPPLPEAISAELAALQNVSDEVLLTLVKYPMPLSQQKELAELTYQAQSEGLNDTEFQRQQELGTLSNRAILRRTLCLDILQKRGYALETLLQLPDDLVL